MVKHLNHVLLGAIMLLAVSARAAHPLPIIESAAPLDGAVRGISDSTIVAYLPGYGLNIQARFLGTYSTDTVLEQLVVATRALAPNVRGLPPGEFVSVIWRGRSFSDRTSEFVLVRMVPSEPESQQIARFSDALPQFANTDPFEGALRAISDTTMVAFLHDYGLNVNARYRGSFSVDSVVELLQTVVTGFAPLFSLDDLMLSVAWEGRPSFWEDPVHVVVRMNPGDPTSLETFVNGTAR